VVSNSSSIDGRTASGAGGRYPNALVWPECVVMLFPFSDDYFGLIEGIKYLCIENLIS